MLGERSYNVELEEHSPFSLLKGRSRGDLIVLCEVPSQGKAGVKGLFNLEEKDMVRACAWKLKPNSNWKSSRPFKK